MDTGFCHLIGQISWLLIVWTRSIQKATLDREPVDWRYDLVEDVYVIIKPPQLTIHIRKYFVSNGE
jgi:hypothetical protein